VCADFGPPEVTQVCMVKEYGKLHKYIGSFASGRAV